MNKVEISVEVEELSDDFVGRWNDFLKINPILELDYSWPSLGVIDLITFSCRDRREIPPQLDPILSGVAAYLAIMAGKCWASDVVDIRIWSDSRGVCLEASGGDLIPAGENVFVPVEELFRKVLQNLPNPFPVTREYKVGIRYSSNVVSSFGLGLFTGLIPGLEGCWEQKDTSFLGELSYNAAKELARTSVERYARLYPDEPLGQDEEFYLRKLIYPPSMYEEEKPLLGALPYVFGYFENKSVQKEAALSLGQNLALSLDPRFSDLGLVLTAALSDGEVSPNIIAVARQKGDYLSLLRDGVVEVRKHFGMQEDWIDTGLQDERRINNFAVEKSMRMLPWLSFSKPRLVEDAEQNLLSPFLTQIAGLNLIKAIRELDKLIEITPEDIDLRVQRIKLAVIQGGEENNEEEIDKMFRVLMSETDADKYPAFFNLWGSYMLGVEDPERALRYFKAALALDVPDRGLHADILNNAAWANIVLEHFVPALEYLEKALKYAEYPIAILLNRGNIFLNLKQFKELQNIRRILFALAPGDRRVFASLALTEEMAEKLFQS